ncbi:protein SAMBA [Neltuma alba]|uniref:protein SAMBA-like n=1 Tax=Neltuma alba TaxID=207710 RepID=UPI0010A2BEEB|nr:protein SAMBA-like [Prosopis alba]XP_028784438.1 protein SAMBA-like [Prosopis alba]
MITFTWSGSTHTMSSSSPAHSSISTTAIAGGGGAGGSNSTLSADDFHFPCDPLSTYERKDEAMLVLKKDLMAALDKEVKSLDEDNWKFEGPRSRIHLVSRGGGGFLRKPSGILELELTQPEQ